MQKVFLCVPCFRETDLALGATVRSGRQRSHTFSQCGQVMTEAMTGAHAEAMADLWRVMVCPLLSWVARRRLGRCSLHHEDRRIESTNLYT